MESKRLLQVLLSFILISLTFSSLYGDNPELSIWLKNISEPNGTASHQLGWNDDASEIEISGSTIHVMWLSDSSYFKDYIFYTRSTDNGNTWEQKKRLVELDHNNFAEDLTSNRMVVSGDYVHIVYNQFNPHKIMYIRSTDGGATFEEPRLLQEGYVGNLYVSGSGNNLSVLLYDHWIDGTFFTMNSSDNGDTFLIGEIGETPNEASLWSPGDVVRDENYIYALTRKAEYYNGIIYGNLYLSVSSDGIVFQNTKISVPSSNGNDKTLGLQDQNYCPKIAVSGPHINVIWSGLDENDSQSVFIRHSPDRGRTWDDVVKISGNVFAPGELPQTGQESIIAMGSHVYAMFLSTSGYIYVSTSHSSGESFLEAKKITAPAGTMHIDGGWWPNCTLDPTDPTGQTAYFIWSYPTYVVTRDGGNTYTKPITVGTQYSWRGGTVRPRICIGEDGSIHYITEGQYYWNYYRDSDIFYRRLDPAQEPIDNEALQLNYVYQGDRYDNMAVPSSPSLQLSDQITLEAWIKPDPGTERNSRIVTKEDVQSYIYGPKAYQLATHDYANGRYANTGIRTTTGEYVNWGGEIKEGEWNHIAMTYNSLAGENNFILYVNGQLSTSMTVTGELVAGDGELIIGPVREVEGFNGLIDEVRIWDRALPLDMILSRMYRELDGDELGLMAYYNFNNTTKDITGLGNDGILAYREEFVESVISAPDGDQDGISDLEEWGPDGADYEYDGNDDGLADWHQSNVASLHTFLKDKYVSLSVPPEVSLINVIPSEGPGSTPDGYTFPFGFFEFLLKFSNNRSATTVDLHLHDGLPVNTYYNYGTLPGVRSSDWYEFLYDQQTGATIGENMITLAFVDGLRGDHDLTADGTIVTMGGPAKESEGIDEKNGDNGILRLYPNPCHTTLHVLYSAPVSGQISLDLYTVRGEKVDGVRYEQVSPGEHLYRFDTGQLDDGIYYLVLKAGSYQETKKVTVINP